MNKYWNFNFNILLQCYVSINKKNAPDIINYDLYTCNILYKTKLLLISIR